jgi:hypothetical protein
MSECRRAVKSWGFKFVRKRFGVIAGGFFSGIEGAFFFKEGAEDLVVEVFENPTSGFEVVVTAGQGTEVGGTAEAAHFFIGKAEKDFANTGNDEGTRTHRAGFFGDVEGTFVESPIAEGVGGL